MTGLTIWIWIAGFGALGAVSRFGLSQSAKRYFPDLPMGTLLANLVGCFLIGILSQWLLHRFQIREEIKMGILVGFLGAFTTYSSFSIETIQLFQSGKTALALAYGIGTPLACISLCYLGFLTAR